MKTMLYYLLQMIFASGILYAYYHFALRNKRFHHYNRFYLLAATVISITIPFLNIPVYFTQAETNSSFVLQTLTAISPGTAEEPVLTAESYPQATPFFTWQNVSYLLYVLIAAIVLLRVIISLINIRRIKRNNPSETIDNIRFINTSEPSTPFSFFRWLFWNKKIELHSERGEQIFRHELFHIQQKHSWDIMYLEILSVLFWINPFFYLIKKEVKAIHEFLADHFAINENKKWEYAELLLMQALNTNHRLVNPFFHNQIKRRIAMIASSNKPRHQYLRKLIVLPLAAIVIGLFAFNYKELHTKKADSFSSEVELLQDTAKKESPDTIVWIQDLSAPEKKSPTHDLLTTWGDPKVYEVWFDGKRISNSNLEKHTPFDFSYYHVSELEKNGTIYGKHYYQVSLMTNEYYNMTYKNWPKRINTKLTVKYTRDTRYPFPMFLDRKYENFLIVIDGVIQEKMTAKEIGNYLTSADIKSITILNSENALLKYGEKGKYGVIEIITEKMRVLPITNNNIDTTKPATKNNKVFDQVEIEPAFPGGNEKWKEYLKRNLKATIPLDKKAPKGVYTVVVQFIVSKEGNISEVKALTKHGYGMEEEAMRVIKLGPRWIPAIQSGIQVNAYRKQPITFYIAEENKKTTQNTNHSEVNDYSDPSCWDYNDPEFKKWWHQNISDVKAMARKEGKAAYVFKGRTYVFARITNPDPGVATFTEQTGTNHLFLLNGELINSVDEINQRVTRNDIVKLELIFPEEAVKRFNHKEAVVSIQTAGSKLVSKN